MFTKKVVKKLLDKYKIAYSDAKKDIKTQRVDVGSAQYRVMKLLCDDYKLKISVLESILKDIEVGMVDSLISMDEYDAESLNFIRFGADLSMLSPDLLPLLGSPKLLNNSSTVSDNAIRQCNIDEDYSNEGYKEKGGERVVANEIVNSVSAQSETLNIKKETISNDTIVCTFKGYGFKDMYGTDMLNPMYETLSKRVEKVLLELILKKGVNVFVSGGSLGFDTIVYFALDRLKIDYPYIKNCLALPYYNQDAKWSERDKEDYIYMKENADSLVYVDEVDSYNTTKSPVGEFNINKLKISNEYMIDHSDILVALYRGEHNSGVGYCVKYAQSKGLNSILVVNPDKL